MSNIYIFDKRRNKGFTLIELIVVIVILAILIGVTIGGIYMYIGQARVNTDKRNLGHYIRTIRDMSYNEDMRKQYNLDSLANMTVFGRMAMDGDVFNVLATAGQYNRVTKVQGGAARMNLISEDKYNSGNIITKNTSEYFTAIAKSARNTFGKEINPKEGNCEFYWYAYFNEYGECEAVVGVAHNKALEGSAGTLFATKFRPMILAESKAEFVEGFRSLEKHMEEDYETYGKRWDYWAILG